MDFQKQYELAQLLMDNDKENEIERFVSPENLPQIMRLLNIQVATPAVVSCNQESEEIPQVENAPHWPRYFEYLRTKEDPWNNRSLKSLDISTQKILEKIPRASEDTFDSTGLVVGYVQAGKTANYTGLIAKAADQGYNLFIIFTGITNKLREQTQRRLEKELFGSDYIRDSVSKPPLEHRWRYFTTGDEDFTFNLPPEHLIGSNPCIIIAKKFHTVLDNIVEFLNTADTEILDAKKLLLIDDEADYASINTLGDEDNENEEPGEDHKVATKTNEALRRIRKFFKTNIYVGYTATPFANVLIDPHYIDDDLGRTLYPRDFIISLPQPDAYLGTDSFFPDSEKTDQEADKLCIVPLRDADIMREGGGSDSKNFGLPDSFLLAFIDFLLTGGAKTLRLLDHHSSLNNPHHTMLVQTHHEIATHELTRDRLEALWNLWKNDLIVNSGGSWLIKEFEERWKNEFTASPERWSELCDVICDRRWLERVMILTVNTDSPVSLDYEQEKNGLMVVAIGGFSLGRGLTLEGLTTSFFARTSNNYDTLLQMGRWFGFRKGYEDLVRVHLTGERYSCFRHLAVVEGEIRFDIARYDRLGCTPMELAVRIQTHHTMKVTSSMKMGTARRIQKGWSASTVQTTNFDFAKTLNLNHNLSCTDIFLQGLGKDFIVKGGNYVWKNVDSKQITDFISEFQFGKNASNFDAKEIIKYIDRVNNKDEPELTQWSVALAGKGSGSSVPFGPGPMVPVQRGRFPDTDDIGALVDSNHWTLDLPGKFKDYTNEKGNFDKGKMLQIRRGAEASGLLLIYVIDKEAKPVRDSKTRVELFRDDEERVYVVGLAIAFPESPSEMPGRTYLANIGVQRYDDERIEDD